MEQRYCSNCGRELGEESRFCPSCGRSLSETALVSTPEADTSISGSPATAQQSTGSGHVWRNVALGCVGIPVVLLVLLVVLGAIVGTGEEPTSGPQGGGGQQGAETPNPSPSGDASESQEASPEQAPPEQSESASSGDSGSSSGGGPDQGTIPGDGTFIVGEDIQPGTYESEGSDFCYWERLSGTSGTLDDIITNGNPTGPTTITISPSDAAFGTQGCSEWTLR